MNSKLPKFTSAFDTLYKEVTPHTRTCSETGDQFSITQRDIEMYRSLGVPLPTLSPRARLRRLRAAVGGLDLFKRTDLNGNTLISMFDPESTVPILSSEEWHADTFDAMKYGRAFQSGTSFFDQWLALSNAVPRPAMIQDGQSENSPWALYSTSTKNGYFTYGGMANADISYADFCVAVERSADVSLTYRSNHCYDSVLLNECSNVHFSERCEGCSNVVFSLGCRNCTDCFGCTNLRNKQHCFLNEQLTAEDYTKRLAEIDLTDAAVVEAWRKTIRESVWKQAYRKAGTINQSEEAFGDDLVNCKQVEGISMHSSERVYHSFTLTNVKDTIDLALGFELERCVNLVNTLKGYENKMVNMCDSCVDVEYSELLTSCQHCFGCIGLKNKQFCILNVQYTEEEYWPLVDQIKSEMLSSGEYGQFFPYRVSPWAYNTSHANALFPLEAEDVEALPARWYLFAAERSTNALPITDLPTTLHATTDAVLTNSYQCPVSGRAFRIVKPELELHRSLGVALPRLHPTVRRTQRAEQLFAPVLHERTCADCKTRLMTRIPAEHAADVVCELCYEKRVLAV